MDIYIYICQYIKILNVCVSVCVKEVGSSRSVTRLVMHDIHTYTLYYVCMHSWLQQGTILVNSCNSGDKCNC